MPLGSNAIFNRRLIERCTGPYVSATLSMKAVSLAAEAPESCGLGFGILQVAPLIKLIGGIGNHGLRLVQRKHVHKDEHLT